MIEIGQNILLEISKDCLSAYITLIKDENDSIDVNLTEYIDEIKSHIKYGLDKSKLISILSNKTLNTKILIAKGLAPVNGKDGSIKYNFDMEKPLLPKINPDGTVDYRELDAVNSVEKNYVLAEIIPPSEGKVGIRVSGEEISYKKGRTPKFNYGENVSLSFDGNSLTSNISGLVECIAGKICVLDILKVENVDSSIGNIDFDGSIIVEKDILNGYSVKVTNSAEVKGAVEGGYIKAGGDVLIRQGIQGYNKLAIESNGNLSTKFIENAIIKVNSNITSEAIMHSDVSSNSNVLVLGRKGLIVGGVTRATYEIRARIIGSTMATTTVVEVGANPNLIERYEEIKECLKTRQDNLGKIKQSLNILEPLNNQNKLDKRKKDLYDDLKKAKLSLNIDIDKLEKEKTKINDELKRTTNGQIKVADTIYPGVKVVIGDSYMFIKKEMKRCTFYREGGEIRVGSY